MCVFFAAVESTHVVVEDAKVVDGEDEGGGRGLRECEEGKEGGGEGWGGGRGK